MHPKPLFAPVQVEMRVSGDFFHQYLPSLYQLLLLKLPEYNHIFFVKSCIIILFMLLLICLHYLHFSRAGLCMLPIGFSLAAAMCTQGSSAWLTTKISCIFRTACQNNFKFSVQLGQILYFCVALFVNLTGVQKKFPRWVCGGWSVSTQADICRSGASPR